MISIDVMIPSAEPIMPNTKLTHVNNRTKSSMGLPLLVNPMPVTLIGNLAKTHWTRYTHASSKRPLGQSLAGGRHGTFQALSGTGGVVTRKIPPK